MAKAVIQLIQGLLFTIILTCVICVLYLCIANNGFSSSTNGGKGFFDFSFASSASSPSSSQSAGAGGSSAASNDSDSRQEKPVFIKTHHAQFRGFRQSVFGHDVDTFLGIPYANPPVGPLRFRKPTGIMLKEKQIMPADKFKHKCVQLRKEVPVFTDVSAGVSEDCLYLNVWSPVTPDQELLPVMVWLYGGGFFMGTSAFDETDGRVLAAFGQVVVVTLDYRVGGLGFIDLGTESEPGNQGLYDQSMALKWVKDNIKKFGGDPQSVTLFGESSGAIAIGLHIMAKESAGLFKRAILMSGSPFMTNAFYTRSEKSVPDFVRVLGCGENDQENGYDIACLRSKTVGEIVEATEQMHKKYFFAFPPTPEEEFLPMMPSEVTRLPQEEKQELLAGVQDVLIGNNDKAFAYMLWLANRQLFGKENVSLSLSSVDQVKQVMSNDVGHLLNMAKFQVNFLTQRLFKDLLNETDSSLWLDRLVQILGDVSFVCPANILMDELVSLSGKSVYSYEYTHRPSTSPWGQWMGCTLHDEIAFVFGHPLRFPDKYSGADIEVSKRMMRTWATFARTGRPDDQMGTQWPQVTPDSRPFLRIGTTSTELRFNHSQQTCETFRLGFELLN